MSQAEDEAALATKVAEFIREKRLARGETQAKLAERAFNDKSKRTWINKIEKGRPIGLFTLHKILIALNCDIDFIEN